MGIPPPPNILNSYFLCIIIFFFRPCCVVGVQGQFCNDADLYPGVQLIVGIKEVSKGRRGRSARMHEADRCVEYTVHCHH